MPGDPILQRIAQFIARHQMLPASARVGVAVSGGADSVFLLEALRELAPRWNLHLSVIHIDHGIRGAASHVDAAFVQDLAAHYRLPFHLHEADVPAIRDNLEQAARNIRQAYFAQLLSSGTVHRIATGHTRSDQAETVLYRLMRGSGLRGLSGILPVTTTGIVRPLLDLDRREIECWLRKRNIPWHEDETNQNRAYARNRLRHEILPLLRGNFNQNLDETLAHMAALAQDEESYWNEELNRLAPQSPKKGPQILFAPELAALPPALARRLIRRAIELAKGNLRQVGYAHIERILEMTRSRTGHDRVRIPGLDVLRSFDWIRVAPQAPKPDGFVFSISPKTCEMVELLTPSARITLQILEKTESSPFCDKVVDELDWERFLSPNSALPGLEVRNWRPGDQYQRVGHSHRQKLKDLFQEARVPLWERCDWPIVTYNESIVWTKRFGAAADFAAGRKSRLVLKVGVSECRNRLDQG